MHAFYSIGGKDAKENQVYFNGEYFFDDMSTIIYQIWTALSLVTLFKFYASIYKLQYLIFLLKKIYLLFVLQSGKLIQYW